MENLIWAVYGAENVESGTSFFLLIPLWWYYMKALLLGTERSGGYCFRSKGFSTCLYKSTVRLETTAPFIKFNGATAKRTKVETDFMF